MNIVFQGFDRPIQVGNDFVSMFSIANHTLLSRIIQSLNSGLGEQAIEPYAFFDEKGKSINVRNSALVITSPFDLPWSSRALMGSLFDCMYQGLFEDEVSRLEIEQIANALSNRIFSYGLSLQSDYEFSVEWDIRKYLKSFGFQVESHADDSLLDSLIRFITLAFDVSFDKTLIFVGLGNYLEEKDLQQFINQAVFYRISVLLIENNCIQINEPQLIQHGIDEDFIEF